MESVLRIKSIHLNDYKRFSELSITDVPETARLVVLVGPNGSGKSSIFDAFISKARAEIANFQLAGELEQYYEKVTQARHLSDIANRVVIDFHGSQTIDLKSAFQVRSAYRNEADFHIKHLQASRQDDQGPRLARIIDIDAAVSENYARMAWKGMQDLFHAAPPDCTIGHYRRYALGDLHDAMRDLFSDPALLLQDFGAMKSGSFRFAKGAMNDFHYKNLSGGEKAAFDILLDVFVKRQDAADAIFCIDEPELHVATGLQGRLISSILNLLPATTQLWIATHSIGIVREAYRIYQKNHDEVVFLDFSNQNFDGSVSIEPSKPNRTFWANIYRIALDDLASLVAPQRIVICEGDKDKHVNGFDARCYNRIFADESPETLFISRGSAGEVIRSLHLMAIIKNIAEAAEVYPVIDRDDMTDGERDRKIADGTRVLRRRELEEYLYDSKVIRTFLNSIECEDAVIEEIIRVRDNIMSSQSKPSNVKDVSREIFNKIRRISGVPNLGNSREEFALQFLVPALRRTEEVFDEIRQDVLGPR